MHTHTLTGRTKNKSRQCIGFHRNRMNKQGTCTKLRRRRRRLRRRKHDTFKILKVCFFGPNHENKKLP